jgi:hypothetical protein
MDQSNGDVLGSSPGGRFEEVAPCVFVADVLPTNFCDEVLLEFRDSKQWDQAKIAVAKKSASGACEIVGVIDTDRRNAYRIPFKDLDVRANPKARRCLAFVQDKVGAFASAEFGMEFKEFGDAEIIRYPQGGLFKPHLDTHKGNSHRAFTVLIYLNDNCAGGETGFPDLNYKCTPKTGRVLLFLSTQLHCGLPVIEREKNIITFYIFFPGTGRKEA